jgi:hypothetical protein
MASENLDVGTTANDGTGDALRDAFIKIRKMFAELYGQTYSSDTQDLSGATIDIDHGQLADRYTKEITKTDTSGTGASAVTIDWSTGSSFHFSSSLTGDIDLKFDNYKVCQVIDIYGLTGSHTITLDSTATGTEVFHKVGGVDYDGGSTNHLQIVCLDDSASTPVFHYSIGTTASDDTP